MYSQNSEDTLALDYFNHKEGATKIKTLLDIGANDGITFSNSKLLIENGWIGTLLEPSTIACKRCFKNHKNNNENIFIYNFGIANQTGEQEFLESASHLPSGEDLGLLSCVTSQLTERWKKEFAFTKQKAMFYTFKDFENEFLIDGEKFSYISIDAEGYDWDIVKQIDLKKYGVEMLCIEWNGIAQLADNFAHYCAPFGLKELHRNEENIIFAL